MESLPPPSCAATWPHDIDSATAAAASRREIHEPHIFRLPLQRGSAFSQWCKSMERRTRETLDRSEEHTSELQSLMRISYAVFCLKKKKQHKTTQQSINHSNPQPHKIHQI